VNDKPTHDSPHATDAAAAAEQHAPPAPKAVARDYLETILICVIFVIFSRAFVFQQSKIPSGSMMDTLLVGDYIMVNRFIYAPRLFGWESSLLPVRTIQRGDVVVFKHPPHPEVDYIKRVIGLPGDRIELRRSYLYVNGEPIDEPYVEENYRYRRFHAAREYIEDFGPVTVESGHYFVMGDHRNASADSREWGFVPQDLIKGRALLVWWSFEEASSDGSMTLGERLKSWGVKLRHFHDRSRWNRCFKLIR
jgi:signal peptidase I